MATTTEGTTKKTVEEYLALPYSRVLVPEESGGYSAEILEFPGCVSDGETALEAFNNLEEAARNWIDAALEAGQGIPEPTGAGEYSGKIALRLLRGQHQKAVQMAERQGVSLNTFLVEAIAARIGAEELYSVIAGRLEAHMKELEARSRSSARTDFFEMAVKWLWDAQTSSEAKPSYKAAHWLAGGKANEAGAY